ncbi:MAG: HAD-IC family P-type ATPase [Clostridia bacterium]|nr:HAD-IC family P-type ATPase [Clostridia bacterium]
MDKITTTPINPDINYGLNSQQVADRVANKQVNITKHTVGKSVSSIIVDNLLTSFNLIGLIVFILMIVANSYANTFFYVVILANTLVGIVQELRAKTVAGKLKLVTQPTTDVIREGVTVNIPTTQVVIDDLIFLKSGKQIPADSVVVSGSIDINESMLTGESLPVTKNVGDKLLSGSFVVSGSCRAVVKCVGADNYIEQLTAQAKKFKKPKSQLMTSIRKLTRIISICVFPLGVATFCVGFFAHSLPWQEALEKACGSVIGMIPAGMALLTSVTLAVSIIKMARKRALVQDLYSIEMLARVNCLCLDKTGTITDGTMNVQEIIPLGQQSININRVVVSMLTATNEDNETARALIRHFGKQECVPSVRTIPFNSDTKYSAVTLTDSKTYVLGAPECVCPSSTQEIKDLIKKNTSKGLRCLMLATCDNIDELRNIQPCALMILTDNIREDAPTIIKWFRDNDVAVKIISGDNAQTVSVIAGRVGVANADKYISLESLSDEEVVQVAGKYTVFGRVKPSQKALLVNALKNLGHTVAMTGDGINDILAMKQCDCAIAVASGSDATRSVAHIVLMDNKFASMPSIVSEGRQVVNNIQNSSALFLMKTTMTVLVTIFTICTLSLYPFEAMHLYGIEICVIGIPAFFLALRKNTDLIKGKFLSNVFVSTLPKGIALALSVIAVYLLAPVYGWDSNAITTCAMLCMTYAGLVGLLTLCYPFNVINTSVIVGATLATTGLFFILGRFVITSGYIDGLDWTMVLYILCSIAVSTLIIIFGRKLAILVESKIKDKQRR